MDADLRPPARLVRMGRLLLTRTRVTDATIAALMGVSSIERRRIADAEGWPARAAGSRRRAGSPSGSDARRILRRLIAAGLRAIDAEKKAGRLSDPERLARALTCFAKAEHAAQALESDFAKDQARHDEGPPARTLSQLRDDLRGHLLRIRDERRSRGGGAEAGAEPS